MGLGQLLIEYSSKLFDGPLGTVQIGFKGRNLGKTTADTNIVPDQDIKDINYQQDGTKPADYVRTGQTYLMNATFGEINTQLLVLLMAGISSSNTNPNNDSGVVSRSLYQSMKNAEAGGLKVASVNSNGVPSEELSDTFAFYEAIPIVNGDLIQWGADTQRNFPVQFKILWHAFSTGESSTHEGAFGYWGDPTAEDVPAITYPDLEAPIIVTADCPLATSMEIVFDENIAFQTAFDTSHYVAKVNGEYKLSTAGVIATTTLTLTFAAATFSSGDTIEISISDSALQDTESTPNVYAGVSDYPCTESI